MNNEYVRVSKSESSARLWALEPKVRQLVESDPVFAEAFLRDPLNAMRQRFGAEEMPNEGEHLRPLPDGGFQVVFPRTDAAWTFVAPAGELSDELLECVSAGSCIGPNPGPVPTQNGQS